MEYYKRPISELENILRTNRAVGLSKDEVLKRQHKFGFNELTEGKKQSTILLLFNQFKDFMVLVLLGAILVSGILGEYVDAVAIIAIVILNGLLGFYQEVKAEKSLHALKELSAPQVNVLRNNMWQRVHTKEIVVGDIIKFTAGDRLGADVRLIDINNLEIEESSLTGESVPVLKQIEEINKTDLQLGDMTNMAFKGTLVTKGHGIGVVIATGMKTAMGQIANMLQTTETIMTPLQRRLEQLGKTLIIVAILLTLLVVGIGILRGHDMYTMVLAGVSLAVAAIPEGLPAIVTVALALGVQRMIKQKSIVRKLPAVETLGCTTVICSDKTGTMTQNKMTVTHLWSNGNLVTVSGVGYAPEGKFYLGKNSINPSEISSFKNLLTYGMLCNNAEIIKNKSDYTLDGDPTEGALLVAATKAGYNRKDLLSDFTIIKEFSFDSKRKMMTVVIKNSKGDLFAITKGAPDIILNRCINIEWDNKNLFLNEKNKSIVNDAVNSLAENALRTIAIAIKKLDYFDKSMVEEDVEKELTFVGVQGMIDPPRLEVKGAVKECREAGIKTVMITGDHTITAKAIAKDLGILTAQGKVVDGTMLSNMDDYELENVVDDVEVFSRVSPEHKLRIVRALQERGHIVAMTGDGVNDAPAIKAANIGIAMGITGTDVAKEASSLILVDDNFATIKEAIKEGRNIYENIRKFIRYLLASNVGEILVMLFAMILAFPLPLVPIQILWVNLVTDGLPAIALGLDKAEGNVMKRKPRNPKENVFARGLGWKVLSRGFLIGIVTLIAFIIVYRQNPTDLTYAQTIAFATLVLAQLIHVFDCRSEQSIFARNPFGNIYLVIAVISSLFLMLIVIYYEPLQIIFHTTAIELRDWILIISMASIPTFLLIGSFFARK